MRRSRRLAGLLLVVLTAAPVALLAPRPAAAGSARTPSHPTAGPVAGDGGTAPSVRAREAETSWPPALVSFVVFVALGALGAVFTVFWRARRTIRPPR